MPPKKSAKRKNTSANKSSPAKLAKQDSIKRNLAAATKALKASDTSKSRKRKVDDHVHLMGAHVYEDYDAMLNQTNIGHNNNKYYVIQLLTTGGTSGPYYVWNRWGRVGEPGMNKMHGPFSTFAPAEKEFTKKFHDKTKNKWTGRDNFSAVPGKYTLLDMGDEEEEEVTVKIDASAPNKKPRLTKSCSLDKDTASVVNLIFDNDMFKTELKSLNIDLKKLPLGKLSKTQIAKGFEALDEIDDALKANKSNSVLATLTSKFYTIIPHDFGRKIPPVISSKEMLREKLDLLLVLGDIEIAQEMQKNQQHAEMNSDKHPTDIKYEMLNCSLDPIKESSDEYKILHQYFKNTTGGWRSAKVKNIFKMNRKGEDVRFAKNKDIKFRKLLWHGTSPAVVAAILKTGLRIMPHSGGRVGRGIYFASENGKSLGYTGFTSADCGQTGFMFLNEVALGKEHKITRDNSSLTKAPAGFQCVVACGRTEPNPKMDKKLKFDGNDVIVPIGNPIQTSYNSSSFSQSEYLVYQEDQVRMRYVVQLKI